MSAAPGVARADIKTKLPACVSADGKAKLIYGCTSTGPVSKSTLPEAAKAINDRQNFHRCHARQKGGAAYSPTVGWGTYVDTQQELKAGQCPQQAVMEKWFMNDVTVSYQRGMVQAKALGKDNACMVRTLTAINHQLGDLRRKYPDTWKRMSKGELCDVARDMLSWTWYRQSCEHTLDTALALNTVANCGAKTD